MPWQVSKRTDLGARTVYCGCVGRNGIGSATKSREGRELFSSLLRHHHWSCQQQDPCRQRNWGTRRGGCAGHGLCVVLIPADLDTCCVHLPKRPVLMEECGDCVLSLVSLACSGLNVFSHKWSSNTTAPPPCSLHGFCLGYKPFVRGLYTQGGNGWYPWRMLAILVLH
jgi:hypothetical protein